MRILVDEKRKVHPYLENLKSIGISLHKTLGNKSEIIIHDLSNPENSVIFIAGELTDRDLGAPITDLVLRIIKNKEDPDDILNYQTKSEDGRIFKSSTMFVKDDNNEIIGCLCTNYDITDLLLVQNIIGNFASVDNNKGKEQDSNYKENFANNIDEVLNNIIKKAKAQVDKPAPFMEKEDKLKVIEYLDKRGAFTIKGSVETVAEDLGVSRYTIYNYLKEIKSN
ncbi:helix-turn-helix transcriptional regulator [Halanaerobaculum tunisiense]